MPTTSWPNQAKHVAVTVPTYPVPMTATCAMASLPRRCPLRTTTQGLASCGQGPSSARLDPGDLHARLAQRRAFAGDVGHDRACAERGTAVRVADREGGGDGKRRRRERPDLVFHPRRRAL